MKPMAVISLIYIFLGLSFAFGAQPKDLPQLDNLSLKEIKETGNRYARSEQWPQALYCYQTIVSRYKPNHASKEEGSLAATAWNNLGYVYFFGRADYAQAFQCFLQSQEIAQQVDDEEMLPYTNLNLANIYASYKDEANTIKHYRLALEGAKQAGLDEVAVTSISNLAVNAMQKMKPQDVADDIALFEGMNVPPRTPGFQGAHAIIEACIAMRRGENQTAADILGDMRDPGEGTLTPNRIITQCTLLRAALLRSIGQLEGALEALRSVPPDSLPDDIHIDFLEVESEILAALGNTNEAVNVHNKALRISDSLYRRQSYGRIRDMRGDWEMRQAAVQLQEADERSQQARDWALLAAGIALVVGTLAVMLVIKNKRLSQANEVLYRKTAEEGRRYEESLQAVSLPANTKEKSASDTELLAKVNTALADESLISTEDFTIDKLAKLVGSNSTYVSRVINAGEGKSFSSLLGEARVRLACRRLTDPAFARYTVEGIAQNLGFRSRTNFIAVFKRSTGLTPTEYKKLSLKEG